MANQKMKLQRVKFVAHFLERNPTMYRAAVKSQSVVTGTKLITNIANHAGLPVAITSSILRSLTDAINDYLEAGHAVQIENLCTFKPKVRSKGKADIKAVNAKRYRATFDAAGNLVRENDGTIKSVALQVWPIGDVKRMVEDFQFVIEGTVEGEDPEEEDEDLNP